MKRRHFNARPDARRLAARAIIALLLAATLTGCISRKRVLAPEELPFPALTASRSELLEGLEQRGRTVRTLNATVTLVASGGSMTTGVLTSYRETKGFLVVERPSNIRVIGQAPLALATVFDMVSDGEMFRVSVPVRNKFIVGDTRATGTADNAILNLRPQHIMDALFVDVRDYVDSSRVLPILEESLDGRRSFYVFSFVDTASPVPQLVEKVWIDRRDLRVTRKQIFGENGRIETDVSYESYQGLDGVPFPQEILIRRPVEDYSVRITFQKTTLNAAIPEDAFDLETPPGADLIRVGEQQSSRF